MVWRMDTLVSLSASSRQKKKNEKSEPHSPTCQESKTNWRVGGFARNKTKQKQKQLSYLVLVYPRCLAEEKSGVSNFFFARVPSVYPSFLMEQCATMEKKQRFFFFLLSTNYRSNEHLVPHTLWVFQHLVPGPACMFWRPKPNYVFTTYLLLWYTW